MRPAWMIWTACSTRSGGKGRGRRVVGKCRDGWAAQAPRDHRGAFRCRLRAERARHAVHGAEGAAAVQRRRLDLHDRVERLAKGLPRGWSGPGASKAVQQGSARVWAAELKDRGIRVNVLTPGQVATAKQEELFDEETKRQFESLIPRGKMGRPEEIATVALFLASDDSSYVNGMELVADGGTTAI